MASIVDDNHNQVEHVTSSNNDFLAEIDPDVQIIKSAIMNQCKQYTVVAKRIRTHCYFNKKEQMEVKRSSKSRKTVMLVPEIQCVYLIV